MTGSSPHTRGTPRCKAPGKRATGDHPRIRGEHPVGELPRRLDGGIIPAYAGNTVPTSTASPSCDGSSPHTRGTLTDLDEVTEPQWIIPAYAGNTCKITTKSCALVDHPRIRGEHMGRNRYYRIYLLDHPRIRGEHAVVSYRSEYLDGIIPAYAGNTRTRVRHHSHVTGSSPHTRGTLLQLVRDTENVRDHPRIRGEHVSGYALQGNCFGIIPAYAGNTRR